MSVLSLSLLLGVLVEAMMTRTGAGAAAIAVVEAAAASTIATGAERGEDDRTLHAFFSAHHAVASY